MGRRNCASRAGRMALATPPVEVLGGGVGAGVAYGIIVAPIVDDRPKSMPLRRAGRGNVGRERVCVGIRGVSQTRSANFQEGRGCE